MNFIARFAKIFAIQFLIFANFLNTDAQLGLNARLPAGTRITMNMDSEISSKRAAVNDTFTSTVIEPIRDGNAVLLPYGTVIEGRVVGVERPGYGRQNGRLQVRFESIQFPNRPWRPMQGSLVKEVTTETNGSTLLISSLAGSATGGLIGAVAGGEPGAVIGAGIGAGAGAAIGLLRKGKDVFIKTNEKFEIVLNADLPLPVSDY
ncbi:MAG TPA: hypothetical protein PKD26_13835 [Pyrinomonadaceae bacterium]|nr:hypothetical protein [Pyrinomonadaceae bacterium]